MNLSNTSRWTHRCPLARLSAVRWTIGMFAATLWFRVGFADLVHDELLWTLLAAMIATLAFGVTSSGMLMLRPRAGTVTRLTDWYGIVASVITWVIALGAAISMEISWLQAALLFTAVASGVAWLAMIYFGLRPIRLGAIRHE